MHLDIGYYIVKFMYSEIPKRSKFGTEEVVWSGFRRGTETLTPSAIIEGFGSLTKGGANDYSLKV